MMTTNDFNARTVYDAESAIASTIAALAVLNARTDGEVFDDALAAAYDVRNELRQAVARVRGER